MRLKHPFCSTLSLLWTLGLMSFLYIANAQAEQAMLAWDANTEPTLGGYQLYYGQASGNYTANVDVGKQTSYTLSNLQDGATYYFAVTAYDSARTTESGFSNEVSKTFPQSGLVADFTATPTSGMAPLTVTFTDTSTGNITDWSWDFGDGTTSTAKTAAKTYTNPDTYTVSLTVSGPGGSNTTTKTISVTAALPVANFSASPTSGIVPLAVTFTNSSTNATSYSWDFGDGGTSTAQNPAHTYTTAGIYTVELTATGSGGTNSKTGNITVSSSDNTGGGNSGLVAAYSFGEVSGTTVVDASGQGNHGTISGAVPNTSGMYGGKALSFDGVDDWVTIKDAPSLDLTTGMTLEAWVYPTAALPTWPTVIVKEQPDALVYSLYANSNTNNPSTYIFTSSEVGINGGEQLPLNTWTHLAATYDGANLRHYVNGVQTSSRAVTGELTTSAGALRIGGNSVWNTEYFAGRIDNVRIYNRALTQSEIQTNMNTSVVTSSPPIRLVGTYTIGPVTDSNPQGTAQAFQTQATVTGLVTHLSVYLDTSSTATKLVAGIYADNNGHPDTLLAQGTLTSPGAGGWKRVSLPATSLTAGKTYWIAILSPSDVLQFRDAVSSVSQLSETSAQSTLTTLPSTWTTGTVYYDGQLSAYGAGY
jgi:PKD repeat protein